MQLLKIYACIIITIAPDYCISETHLEIFEVIINFAAALVDFHATSKI